LFLTQVVLLFITFFITILNAINHPEKVFLALAFSAITMGIVNFYFQPFLGPAAAPVALFVTSMLLAVATLWKVTGLITIRIDTKAIGKIVFSAMVMALGLIAMRTVIPGQSAIILGSLVLMGSVVYFIVIFTLDTLFYEEVKQLIRLVTE
jgi:O-antigen/teichoic acid export membrane protein